MPLFSKGWDNDAQIRSGGSIEGNRALRKGDWKIVAAGTNSPWELYDLRTDRAESTNLADQMPEKVRELAAEWTRQMEEYSALARKDAPPATNPKQRELQD